MNQSKIILSLACLVFFVGCYQKSATNSQVKTAPTAAASSPVAEKSPAPAVAETVKTDNGDELSQARKAVESKPDDAEANYKLGKIYYDRKDYEKSLPFIQKASKIKFTSVEYLLALGDNYRELKKCDYAMVPYGKVPGFDEKNTAAYYGMGLCYIELNNRIAASQQVRNLEKYDKALAKKLADQIAK